MFRLFIKHKMMQRGKFFLKIGLYYPSSKICCQFGRYNSELKLIDRTYICPNGCTPMDRDHNAAINIDNEGFRIYKETLAAQAT
ncbi:MAG: transposase [Clostridiales bacterium]|jgi:putative transposase|nr:transposase [Clostridiales bacterium]